MGIVRDIHIPRLQGIIDDDQRIAAAAHPLFITSVSSAINAVCDSLMLAGKMSSEGFKMGGTASFEVFKNIYMIQEAIIVLHHPLKELEPQAAHTV